MISISISVNLSARVKKGTNERYNRELKSFVPKGETFNDYTQNNLNEFAAYRTKSVATTIIKNIE